MKRKSTLFLPKGKGEREWAYWGEEIGCVRRRGGQSLKQGTHEASPLAKRGKGQQQKKKTGPVSFGWGRKESGNAVHPKRDDGKRAIPQEGR